MRRMLLAPSRGLDSEAAVLAAPSPRRGRPAAAPEICLGVIESTRLDGDGFPTLPPSIGNPSGRRVRRPAGTVPAGITKER